MNSLAECDEAGTASARQTLAAGRAAGVSSSGRGEATALPAFPALPRVGAETAEQPLAAAAAAHTVIARIAVEVIGTDVADDRVGKLVALADDVGRTGRSTSARNVSATDA